MKAISNKLLIIIFPLATMQWFGASFTYDFPQVFESVLIQRMQINPFKVQFLYSIGSFPNLVTNLIASLFLPKLGVGYIVLIFQTFVFAGSAINYLAVRANSYTLMCAARIFVGTGFDICMLGMILCCEKWFRGKLLSVSLAMGRFCGLAGTSVSYYLLPNVFLETRSLENSAFCNVGVSFLLFAFTAIFAVLDMKYEHLLKDSGKRQKGDGENEIQAALEQADGDHRLLGSKIASIVTIIQDKIFTFKHSRYISLKSWIMLVYIILIPSIYFQFTNTGTDFFMTRYGLSYGLSYEDSKNTLSILPLLSASILPFSAAMYTNFGFKPLGMFISNLFAVASYSYLALLPTSNTGPQITICLVLFAIFYGLNYGCMWSSLLLSLPKEASGLFIGFSITMQNILFGVMPLFTGWLYRSRTVEGYQTWLYFMVGYCGLVALCAAMIFLIDTTGDRLLMMPENDPRVVKLQNKMSSDFKNSVLKEVARGRSSRGVKTEYATLAGQTASKTWKSNADSAFGTKMGDSTLFDQGKQMSADKRQRGGDRLQNALSQKLHTRVQVEIDNLNFQTPKQDINARVTSGGVDEQ